LPAAYNSHRCGGRDRSQFDRHPLVLLGELHRSRETHAFRQRMRDPTFVYLINDILLTMRAAGVGRHLLSLG